MGSRSAAWDDWRSVEHVVDVGGGTGVLLRALLTTHEHLHGTLFDLPQVVESVEPAERLTIVPGNMFDDPLPAADAHILSQIIHGWPDADAAHILGRCTEAAPRILLVEGILPERPSATDAGFDLFMLTLTGGRQRTEDEFRRLAESIGLELRSTHPLTTGNSLIELRVAR
jgi:2,7-dihydroxy-5-methyl-1-naphthoate 7-O-methyltransferase